MSVEAEIQRFIKSEEVFISTNFVFIFLAYYFWYFMTEKCESIDFESENPAISDGNTFVSSTAVQGRHMQSAGAFVTNCNINDDIAFITINKDIFYVSKNEKKALPSYIR